MDSKKIELATVILSNRRKHDKGSLFYILRILNHSKYFYTYEDCFSRNQILTKVLEEINTESGLEKLLKLNPFKNL